MKPGEFIMKCFHARTAAHVLHLKTKSYAQHKALNKFYDDIIDLIDSYAEVYQGEYGVIADYPGTYRPYVDPVQFIEDLCDWITENRVDLHAKTDTHLSNIVDEILALVATTKYKLKVLK